MAVYRQVQITFWQDSFVLKLTPEEKFFYLYLLTNSKTKQCGIYELPLAIIQIETGYNRDTVIKLIQRFIEHDKIAYDWENEEVFLHNWIKHNPFENNPKILKCIQKELKSVHNPNLIPLTSPLQGVLQKEKEKEKEEKQEKDIPTLWIRTFGRNPKLPETEVTEHLIKKFGYDKVHQIFKDATLKGFKNLNTLVEALDENGKIKPRDSKFTQDNSQLTSRYKKDTDDIRQKLKANQEKLKTQGAYNPMNDPELKKLISKVGL